VIHQLALCTFGVFAVPADDPANDGFHERNDPILAAAERAPGFVARSGYEDEPGPLPWGEQVYPRFYIERGDGWSPATLSLWADLESAFAFSYNGLHGEALAHGRDWMVKPSWPPYALWWVAGDGTPDWHKAVMRHEHLHENGALPFAFNFKQPYDASGQETEVNRIKARRIAAAAI
jgi:hypothetical protein